MHYICHEFYIKSTGNAFHIVICVSADLVMYSATRLVLPKIMKTLDLA